MPNEVEIMQTYSAISGEKLTSDQAIKKLATLEMFLQSTKERQWRNNAKEGDFCYAGDGTFVFSTHCWKVFKVTKTRVHAFTIYAGIVELGPNKGKEYQGKVKIDFDKETGRNTQNPAMMLTRDIYNPTHHERGLEEQEYKKRFLANSQENPPYGPATTQELEQGWFQYKLVEQKMGAR